MVHSVTRWNHLPMIGGIAVNLRFAPSRDPVELAGSLRPLLETFMRLGGFEAQANVVSSETLRAARLDPEQHRDLVVRVAGYSDFFVRLSSEIQEEIITRFEHELR